MKSYTRLLLQNQAWSRSKKLSDPEFFVNLSKDQTPEFLWIGCSDSRVPADEITGTEPGEIFVHRNIANLVVHTDLNLLSVLQYAVEVLKVKHIVVCGHYGCGGVKAAMTNKNFGLINKWLRNIKDVYRVHRKEIDDIISEEDKFKKLCEFNVIEQVNHLMETSIVQKAWKTENAPMLHGWIYSMGDGVINELIAVKPGFEIDPIYRFEIE